MAMKRNVSMGEGSGGDSTLMIGQAFAEFIEAKKVEGVADKTIGNYVQSINYFLDFNEDVFEGDNFPIAEVSKAFVEQWVDSMKEIDGKRISTINHYLRDVRAFLYWCMDEEREYLNPYKIKLVKGQEELPKGFTIDEVKVLLKEPNGRTSAYWVEWRTWAIINWIVATGNRCETICNIRIGDIDFTNKDVALQHTKNKKAQKVPLPSSLMYIIKKYINLCRRGASPKAWLFPNVGNEQLSYSALYNSFRDYCLERGVEKTSPHSLRHFFATESIRKGMRGDYLQKVLGHSTYTMTQKYITLVNEDLKQGVDEYNPLENFKKGTSRTKKVGMD